MSALAVVVPIFNEEAVLEEFVGRLRPVLTALQVPYQVIAVDDGSTDDTPVLMQRIARDWPQFRVVRLRANAGHQGALSAGLLLADSDYVVTIDADLQDPPEVIAQMYHRAVESDCDVVYAARSNRDVDSWFKRSSAGLFYRLINRLVDRTGPQHAGDFRLMSRATITAVNALPAQGRVLRLVVPGLGFPSETVHYDRHERAAGETKYPLRKMIQLSLNAVTGYSLAPLRLATWLGLIGGLAGLALMLYALGSRIFGHTVPGWTSIVVIIAAVSSVQLLCLGILGEYVGRLYAAGQGKQTFHIAYDSHAQRQSAEPSD